MATTTQTASHWGVYNVETTERGEVLSVSPFAHDRWPPRLIEGLPEIVRSHLRIDQPYVREGYLRRRGSGPHNRGGEPFVPVDWITALDLIEHELHRVKAAFGNGAIYGGEPIEIHVADARTRGIVDGDIVRVFNDRGAFLAGAVLVDHLLPGVAQIATGAWYDPAEPGRTGSLEKHGNPNVVTLDQGTSQLSQAPMAQTVLVEIEIRQRTASGDSIQQAESIVRGRRVSGLARRRRATPASRSRPTPRKTGERGASAASLSRSQRAPRRGPF